MWIAKDQIGTIFAYETKPIADELTGCWYIASGYYFEIPPEIVHELLGRSLKLDETIEVELKKS
jgi:hypothetical protein